MEKKKGERRKQRWREERKGERKEREEVGRRI